MEIKSREDWLAWRKKGIGSSDASIVMGVSRFKTPFQLYEDKISTEIKEESSFIANAGNDAEGKVRAYYEFLVQKSFPPALLECSDVPFMLASLDGLSNDGEMAEIKLVGKDKFEQAQAGIVPEDYLPQVQHGLFVSKTKVCHYISYLYDKDDRFLKNPITKDRLAVVMVKPDKDYQDIMIAKEAVFWSYVQNKTPPPLSDDDYKKIRSKDVKELLEAYRRAKLAEQKATEELEVAKNNLISIVEGENHPRIIVGESKIHKIARVGNINYKKIPELNGVDLEKYRGNTSYYWRIDV